MTLQASYHKCSHHKHLLTQEAFPEVASEPFSHSSSLILFSCRASRSQNLSMRLKWWVTLPLIACNCITMSLEDISRSVYTQIRSRRTRMCTSWKKLHITLLNIQGCFRDHVETAPFMCWTVGFCEGEAPAIHCLAKAFSAWCKWQQNVSQAFLSYQKSIGSGALESGAWLQNHAYVWYANTSLWSPLWYIIMLVASWLW